MTREIKFRAWISKEGGRHRYKKMYDWSDILESVNEEFNFNKSIFGLGLNPEHKDSVILMQYIGLKDKNGKEIYEGDIVKFLLQGFIKAIVWNNGGFCIEDKRPDRIYYHPFTEFVANNKIHNIVSNMEIVGNIYENKEMVENGEDLSTS